MVGAVNNFFSPGDKVITVNGGKFGERWTKICKAYGLQAEEIIVEWGYAVKPETIEAKLKNDPSIKGVFVQASETSTGVYHDIEALAKVVKNMKTQSLLLTPYQRLWPMTSGWTHGV